jgi:hypothetical protein
MRLCETAPEKPPFTDPTKDAVRIISGDHIMTHIEEKYYVPSLLRNAVLDFPTKVSPMSRALLHDVWYPNTDSPVQYHKSIEGLLIEQLTAALLAYIRRQLGLA